MNIILPIAGKGERFSKCGYRDPKPLIPIFDKTMIDYVLSHLQLQPEDNIFIIYNQSLNSYSFSEIISKNYPSFRLQFIQVNDTRGAAETLYLGIDFILRNYTYAKKCLLIDCDTFYTEDIVSIFRHQDDNDNMIFYTKKPSEPPIYSYIQMDEENRVLQIAEKQKISENANTGAYAFRNIHELYQYCKYVVDHNIVFTPPGRQAEQYTSCVIHEMLSSQQHRFVGFECKLDRVFSLGTPNEVEAYVDKTHAFLFDLDGTLVITDDIYYNVWSSILLQYNIVLTPEIFQKFIQGNHDTYVANTFLHNIHMDIHQLSKQKDELFIQHLEKIRIVPGIYEFLRSIRLSGHKACIVTNCNKRVANEIVKYIGIEQYVDFIISADDCIHGKPNQEPYWNAIQRYHIDHRKCIIFEDSKSGLLSASGVNPKRLIGMETIYTKDELKTYGVHFSISDFTTIGDAASVIVDFTEGNQPSSIQKMIVDCFDCEIQFDENKLKGGFIADVIRFSLKNENKYDHYIVKYEKEGTNNLSLMAQTLDLYQREYYFYKNIAPYVPMKIPKFINVIIDDDFIEKGVILENLFETAGFQLNLDLNTVSIDVSLKIIDRMARMHAKFWNKQLKKKFAQLHKNNDSLFCPFFSNFLQEKYPVFKEKWKGILSTTQLQRLDENYANFENIQQQLSDKHLTFIHGDVKSANLFFDTVHENEPYFLDWQHCAIGKGVQDLVFFIMESFDITHFSHFVPIFQHYYYRKLVEYGITNYSFDEYMIDFKLSICYIPFFTSVWFGSLSNDELIDKNWPYFFIQKFVWFQGTFCE